MTDLQIIEEGEFKFIQFGPEDTEPLLLLHGLFGTASNFDEVIKFFSKKKRVIMPILPIFEMSLRKLSVTGLVDYVVDFVRFKNLNKFHTLGNSLGGHLALLLALNHQSLIKSLILTGSSGLYESAFGTSFPKREDYSYIKNKVELTFYDASIATKEMVDEVFDVVNDRVKGIRIVKTAKSAIRHNVADRLHELKVPTLLVWGKQDTITPPFVGEQFNELISQSTLHILDKCGHAPMLEVPDAFNQILDRFFESLKSNPVRETS
jgi:pimeloyl-ACP methyl ester carboxylesterase